MSKQSLFEQKITLKALNTKFGHNSDYFADMIINDPANAEGLKGKFKNVCAALNMPLVERLENTIGLLDMSKRDFFELAIIEALDKADLIIADIDIHEIHRAMDAQQVQDAAKNGKEAA
jgi:hypothetical protein